jgi:acetolactate synthase regulatory subunit
MTLSRTAPAGDRIIEPMVTLAGCSKQQRIVVAGARAVELMLELQRRGYVRTAATANCGHPAGQYDVALVDWRRRTFKTLEVALDWLVDFLGPSGVLVVWVDPQKAATDEALRRSLERRGFVIEGGTLHDWAAPFCTAPRNESGPQSRLICRHAPADDQAAWTSVSPRNVPA